MRYALIRKKKLLNIKRYKQCETSARFHWNHGNSWVLHLEAKFPIPLIFWVFYRETLASGDWDVSAPTNYHALPSTVVTPSKRLDFKNSIHKCRAATKVVFISYFTLGSLCYTFRKIHAEQKLWTKGTIRTALYVDLQDGGGRCWFCDSVIKVHKYCT